jgi:NhaP-type Na+/H+ or K+/H+ antiporter
MVAVNFQIFSKMKAIGTSPEAAADSRLVETALTAVAASGSFLFAQHLRASGVLATLGGHDRDGQPGSKASP